MITVGDYVRPDRQQANGPLTFCLVVHVNGTSLRTNCGCTLKLSMVEPAACELVREQLCPCCRVKAVAA